MEKNIPSSGAPDYPNNIGVTMGAGVIIAFLMYVSFVTLIIHPNTEAVLKQTFVSAKDYTVKDVKVDPTTKVMFEGLEDITFTFNLVKPIAVGQTFALVTSKYEGKPQLTLCEAQPVEKAQMSGGKSAYPVVVVNSLCYEVSTSGPLPAYEYSSMYEITAGAPPNLRSNISQAWLQSVN